MQHLYELLVVNGMESLREITRKGDRSKWSFELIEAGSYMVNKGKKAEVADLSEQPCWYYVDGRHSLSSGSSNHPEFVSAGDKREIRW